MLVEAVQIVVCMVAIIGVIILNRVRLLNMREHQELKDSASAGTDQLLSTFRRRYESLVQEGEDDRSFLIKVIRFRDEMGSKSRQYNKRAVRMALIIDLLALAGGIALLVLSGGRYFFMAALAILFLLIILIFKQMREWDREEIDMLREVAENLDAPGAEAHQPTNASQEPACRPPSNH